MGLTGLGKNVYGMMAEYTYTYVDQPAEYHLPQSLKKTRRCPRRRAFYIRSANTYGLIIERANRQIIANVMSTRIARVPETGLLRENAYGR